MKSEYLTYVFFHTLNYLHFTPSLNQKYIFLKVNHIILTTLITYSWYCGIVNIPIYVSGWVYISSRTLMAIARIAGERTFHSRWRIDFPSVNTNINKYFLIINRLRSSLLKEVSNVNSYKFYFFRNGLWVCWKNLLSFHILNFLLLCFFLNPRLLIDDLLPIVWKPPYVTNHEATHGPLSIFSFCWSKKQSINRQKVLKIITLQCLKRFCPLATLRMKCTI